MQPKNIKEFKELILRYESITLEEIENQLVKEENIKIVKRGLTGFGSSLSCILCKPLLNNNAPNCQYCVYGNMFKCVDDDTFKEIDEATTPQELKAAYKARAKHMRNILKEYYNES
jgi:hypothetical protein